MPDGSQNPEFSSMIRKPAGSICPHLHFEGESAVCSIHHMDCYRGTPCEQFELLGSENDICVLGGYFMTLGKNEI
jgi:hypothetical protein